MSFTVRMPALGETVTEGTVTRWLKQEGDPVDLDEPLLEVSTDKVDAEIPSPVAGVLERIVAGEEETVEVGGELAVIGDVDRERESVVSRDRRQQAAGDAPAEPIRPVQVDQPPPGWYAEHHAPELLRRWNGTGWTGETRRRPDTVFISYARSDEPAVRELAADLLALRVPVWRDEELEGGEPWWEEILRQIRAAAIFLHAVSDPALASEACRAERGYADALGVPVIPVQVGMINNIRSRQELLRQMVDYRKRDVRRGMRLAAAIRAGQQRRRELPDPLPEPPDVPFPYLVRMDMSLAAAELSFHDQQRIFHELRRHLSDVSEPGVRDEICALLCRLRDRDDAFRATFDDITWLLKAEDDRR